MNRSLFRIGLASLALCLLLPSAPLAQKKKRDKKTTTSETETTSKRVFDGMKWRLIGPFRGGRSAAVTGVPGKPNLFYMGSTGGGVWKTQDGGQTWVNISDSSFGGSVGAVAVSEYDNNVLYVGGGEVTVRGNVSYGYGIYKSTDAGEHWEHKGLKNSRHIPRIRIHPKNPDLVYAAVLGDLYKSSEERGVYRSKDGGDNWERILFANADAGAVDLTFDPNNPRILYASTWRVRRSPYSLESGGEGSGLWKSTDGGDTWKTLNSKNGMPKGALGIIGVTVSPLNSKRVWALIEAKEGGLFRSDDGGENWNRINQDRSLRQRAWYYTRIYADTQDEDKLYVMNVSYHVSKDGGRTFKARNAPHGDHHDLWIAPEDNQRMIIADDGGAQISFDGGDNWSTYENQATAQFYRVTTDNSFPYRILVAQQDNSTLRIKHRSESGFIGEREWEPSAGGESAHLAVKPDNNDVVVGGSYGGYLTWLNHSTGERRAINVWPDDPMGHGVEAMKYRFQWNFPVFFSPHNLNHLYTASNYLHRSTDMGNSWKVISPDLTRNDPEKLKTSGGPITKDNTGVEYYCTIFAATESPLEEGLLWTGSDDGLMHLSRDAGKNWENITPKNLPEWCMINSIEISPFDKGAAYIAATSYKSGDYQPYLFKTKDYGKSWQKIVSGIASDHFTRVLRADPKRKGLLYAGTESGMYISFDDGANWESFQLDLPIVPITDLTIKNDNLIAATQGRSIWILDDLTVLHQLKSNTVQSDQHLFKPIDSYRMPGGSWGKSRTKGTNHPGGVMVYYYLKEKPDSNSHISLEFLDDKGKHIKTFSTDAKEKKHRLKAVQGLNRFVWNMRYEDAKKFDGMILWWGEMRGPKAVPGDYQVKLTSGENEQVQSFKILSNPNSSAGLTDHMAQFRYQIKVRDKLTETHEAIIKLRSIRSQISNITSRLDSSYKDLKEAGNAILDSMKTVEEALYQTKNRSNQDPLNFPIRLNNKLAHTSSLAGIGDFRPTEQMEAFLTEVSREIDIQLNKLQAIFDTQVPAFNKLYRERSVDAIILDQDKEK